MDNNHLHKLPTWGGLGLGIVSIFSPYIWRSMPIYLAWTGFLIGVVMIVYGVWPCVAFTLLRLGGIPKGLVPLQDAARIAFEKTQHSAYAKMAAGYQESPSVILRTYAKFLLTNNKRQTYGKLLPSDTVTVVDIDPSELTEDCRSIKPRDRDITHAGLAIRRRDLSQAIKIINRSDDILG